jgi:nicotinamidase-related amidase
VNHASVAPGSTLAAAHPGHAFRPGYEPRAGEPLVTKSVNAAFIGTDLDLRLRRLGVTSVVLFGISTDMCVSTTARVAANLGYRTIVVGDACFTFDQPDADGQPIPADTMHRAHLATLRAEFAEVIDTAGLVAALEPQALRAAG